MGPTELKNFLSCCATNDCKPKHGGRAGLLSRSTDLSRLAIQSDDGAGEIGHSLEIFEPMTPVMSM